MAQVMNGAPPPRMGNRDPSMAPHGLFHCQGEDRWVSIAVRNEEEWKRFCAAMGRAELATDPRFSTLAARKALQKAGLSAQDVDLWEINEAFASVALNSIRMLEIDEEKVNVNGGAVALGHPIGCSGARILGSLALELRRRGGGTGCAAICSGGGQGDAVIIQVAA